MSHSSTPLRGLMAGFLLLALSLASGCQYSHEELFVENVSTVAVPIFQNQSFYKRVEFDMTEALIKEIESRTPYKVTAETGANTVIQGSIVSVHQQLISRSFEAAVPEELQVTIVAEIEWKDKRSGTVIRKRSRVTGTGEYVPARGVGQPFEIAQHAAVADLSRQIVSVMRRDW